MLEGIELLAFPNPRASPDVVKGLFEWHLLRSVRDDRANISAIQHRIKPDEYEALVSLVGAPDRIGVYCYRD